MTKHEKKQQQKKQSLSTFIANAISLSPLLLDLTILNNSDKYTTSSRIESKDT
jgi:hypothetical protein